MMTRKYLYGLLLVLLPLYAEAERIYEMAKLGVKPKAAINQSPRIQKALDKIRKEVKPGEHIVLRFTAGTYHFYPDGAAERTYYISNHDQDNPKKVGIPLEDFHNLTLEGNGANFIFHGVMLPVSLIRSSNCSLKNFCIDFENPHITQVKILKNESDKGITFEPAPWVNYRITQDSLFEAYGKDWKYQPTTGIAFEPNSRHIVYNTGDLSFSTKGVKETASHVLYAPLWRDKRLLPGTIVAMRSWERPTPGIFLAHNVNTFISKVQIHYAQGMGLLAQLCDTISLNDFNVCLKGHDDARYFTTQADATHFSQCKGKITSVNGLYEGMMDDAINVHGIYLKVVERLDDKTLVGRYIHEQTWGFDWGYPGDTVQFIRAETMEQFGTENRIATITPINMLSEGGIKEFKITFEKELPKGIDAKAGFGIENMTWTPEVYFAGNIIRNNRARGCLFSTPRKTVVENNLFDHTSGTAILLCGDCNGWYETGACRDVTIRKNRFINALTNMFQFTNAVISIYPEIPNLSAQVKYFHGGKKGAIQIIDNEFDTFDAPILYAKSVNGLVFRHNTIHTNTEYKPFHWNTSRFLLERVDNVDLGD